MKHLEDKIIIVTGGSGLIGKEIVKNIREEGGIAINAEINIKTNISKYNIKCDVTSEKSVDSLIKTVLDNFDRIDGIVNNAYPRTNDWGKIFEDIKIKSWQKNVDMQMNSTFLICQKISEVMKKQRSGVIVNMASIYGIVGNDFTVYEGTSMTSVAAYSAIKGGIINFSRYLASYLGKYNIRVNCVSPGGIFDSQNPIFVKNYEQKVPLGRMGTPKDISPAVSFLLSNAAEYITGHNLIVDGGWTAI